MLPFLLVKLQIFFKTPITPYFNQLKLLSQFERSLALEIVENELERSEVGDTESSQFLCFQFFYFFLFAMSYMAKLL